jgi:small subunit ribosomal protein S23
MWLMYNKPNMSTDRAYDIARKEFYALRHEEAVEQRIAQEEARLVGGYFGQSALQIGMGLEDQAYDRWKVWAGQQMELKQAASANAIQTFGQDTTANEAMPEDAPE